MRKHSSYLHRIAKNHPISDSALTAFMYRADSSPDLVMDRLKTVIHLDDRELAVIAPHVKNITSVYDALMHSVIQSYQACGENLGTFGELQDRFAYAGQSLAPMLAERLPQLDVSYYQPLQDLYKRMSFRHCNTVAQFLRSEAKQAITL